MNSNEPEILQSFYPNKCLMFASTSFFAITTALFFHAAKDPDFISGGGRYSAFFSSLPSEVLYFIVFASALLTLIGATTLFPNGMYIKVTNKGLICKSYLTFFQTKSIEWNLIDDFYIWSNPQNESYRYVKIKFIKNINPPVNENLISIPGDPEKTLAILKKYLKDFK